MTRDHTMKRVLVGLCGVLVAGATTVAQAAPASPKLDFHGFLRSRGIIADYSLGKNVASDKLVDNRLRALLSWAANDYVSATYVGEMDFQWGDVGKLNGRNEGGALGGDTVNFETKSIYMDVKAPKQPVSARIGLQTVIDRLHQQVIFGDATGVLARGKWDPVDLALGWFKFQEGDDNRNNFPGASNEQDDVDLYMAQLGYAPSKALSTGFDVYYINNQGNPLRAGDSPPEIVRSLAIVEGAGPVDPATGLPTAGVITFAKEKTFFAGPHFIWRLPTVTVDGYFAYNHGTAENARLLTGEVTDVDIRAFNFGARGVFKKVAGITPGVEFFYWSSDDDLTDSKQTFYHSPTWSINSTTSSVIINSGREGLMIFGGDGFSTTYPAGPGGREITGRAYADAGFTAFGMTGIVVNGAYVPSFNENVYVRGAAGYFRTLEDEVKASNTVTVRREGKNLGTEVALRVGYKYTKNFDVSLNGAYAFLGDYYDKTASRAFSATPYYSARANDADPDNPFVLQLVAQYNW